MSELYDLIDQKVIASIVTEDKEYQIEGYVTGVNVNDFYFHEKGEPIMITVTVDPCEDLPEDLYFDSMLQIPLERIRKSWG